MEYWEWLQQAHSAVLALLDRYAPERSTEEKGVPSFIVIEGVDPQTKPINPEVERKKEIQSEVPAQKKLVEHLIWVHKNAHELERAVRNIKERRMLRTLGWVDVGRAKDDVSRAFYRALSELRRHQQWRRDMEIVDVTPAPAKSAEDA